MDARWNEKLALLRERLHNRPQKLKAASDYTPQPILRLVLEDIHITQDMLDAKDAPKTILDETEILTLLIKALKANLAILDFFHSSLDSSADSKSNVQNDKDNWQYFSDQLSPHEKNRCDAIRKKLLAVLAIIENIYQQLDKAPRDRIPILEKGYKDLCQCLNTFTENASSVANTPKKQIEITTYRLTYLLENLLRICKNPQDVNHRKIFKNPNREFKKEYQVPKQFHAVWMGSKLKTKYYRNIIEMYKRAPGYVVNLWTFDPDVLRTSYVSHREGKETQNILDDLPPTPRIKIRSIQNELFPFIEEKCEPHVAKKIINMIRLDSIGSHNWSAVCDVIRCCALLKDGGVYVDADLEVRYELFKKQYVLNQVKSCLTQEEYQQFIVALDPDYRKIRHLEQLTSSPVPSDSKSILIDRMMDRLKNKMLTEPLEKLKSFVTEDSHKLLEEKFGKDYWKQLEGSAPSAPMIFNFIYWEIAMRQFVSRISPDEWKKAGMSLQQREELIQSPDFYRAYVPLDLGDKFAKTRPHFSDEVNSFSCANWLELTMYLQRTHFSIRQLHKECGFYHGESNSCFLISAPDHPNLYLALEYFVKYGEKLNYSKAIDWPELLKEFKDSPRKIAQRSFYTASDVRRSHCFLILDEDQVKARRKLFENTRNELLLLNRLELVCDQMVRPIVVLSSDHKRSLDVLKEFSIFQRCDGNWLNSPSKLYDTTECRRVAPLDQHKQKQQRRCGSES